MSAFSTTESAVVKQAAATAAAGRAYLSLRLGNEEYGIDILRVQEIRIEPRFDAATLAATPPTSPASRPSPRATRRACSSCWTSQRFLPVPTSAWKACPSTEPTTNHLHH